MSTALDIFTDAMQSIGQVGDGQSLSSTNAQLAMRLANRMLQKWSNQKLMLYLITQRPFSLSANVQDYGVGPTGNPFTGQTRPVFVESGVATIPGSTMQNPLNILDKTQWDALPDSGVKAGTNGVPASVWVEYTYPNLTFHVSPIPSTIVAIRLGSWELLQQFTTLFDVLSLPPGYEEALVPNLAIELSDYFDQPISQNLAQLAADGLNTIKTVNAQKLRGALGESQALSSPNTGTPPPAAGQ
jgi:hypothetical protein